MLMYMRLFSHLLLLKPKPGATLAHVWVKPLPIATGVFLVDFLIA